jgi:DNA-binding transcriptional ArsR family regulator
MSTTHDRMATGAIMLSVVFTSQDLAKTCLAAELDPMWEILLSLHLVRQRSCPPLFAEWRRQARADLPAEGRLVLELARPVGYSPDFLTPGRGVEGLEHGIDLMMSAPRRQVRADLEELARWQRPSRWVRRLWEADRGTLHRLGDAVRAYWRKGLEPYWDRVQTHARADRARRMRLLAEGGVERLLSTLHPDARWRPPVLEVHGYTDQAVDLRGRGVLLVPSFFCLQRPIPVRDPALPPVLLYPIQHPPLWSAATRAGRSPTALPALLGRTRAAALQALADPLTTTELADRLEVAPGVASHHATVLRDAGLIDTSRTGNTAVHTLTALGQALRHDR